MNIKPYLIISSRGTIRATKTPVRLEWDEISIRLNIELPDALFEKPSIQASITVPDEAVSAPTIEAEVVDSIQDAIREHTGIEVRLTLTPQE